jgi:O-antigen biosynthesis protein
MTEQHASELHVEELTEKIRHLESELRQSNFRMTQVLEALESHQEKLRAQQTSIARLERIQMEMITGRAWRALRAATDLVRRFVPVSRRSSSDSVALTQKESYLVCDEPLARDKTPRSGIITVRGWCLCEGGVDHVQVRADGLAPVEVKPSIARPDVKKTHSDLDTTGRSGFAVNIDSAQLPNGPHTITIRLISEGIPVREAQTSVVVDHENGFSSKYDRWIKELERPDEALAALRLSSLTTQPLISVLMPVYNTDIKELEEAIQSVIRQSYHGWELCIADDASPRPGVREKLESFAFKDARIKLTFRDTNGGISEACNSAAELATGDYIAFLDHDDTLAPNALAHVCEAINEAPDADLIYSDEDKIDALGRRFEPFFKPDWAPDLLLSENYICHLLVVKRELAERIGRLSSDCDGSQDYDLILRAIRHAEKVHHIPRVLYHWRAGVASTASTIENKSYALDAAHTALARHCLEIDPGIRVEPGAAVGRWRVRYPVSPEARVSIIIASGGKADVLRTNLDGLFGKTSYRNFEVVVIDNSRGQVIEKLIHDSQSKATVPLRYIDYRHQPFNYSKINNEAARQCESPILLFLNDDTSVIAEDWLESMVELVERPEVGAVGAKLLYPSGLIQHAGVVMGIFDNCGHAFKSLDGSVPHYFDFSDVIRNVSAVTGACLMTKRHIFWQVEGFDEHDFAVAFNDIDLCLKIGSAGYRVLYTPHALLYHHEAHSKTSKDLVPHPQEVARMRSKWDRVIARDPFYSPNLTRNDEDYSIRTLD